MVAMGTLTIATLIALPRMKVSATTILGLVQMTVRVMKVLPLAQVTVSVTTALSPARTTLDRRVFLRALDVILTISSVPRQPDHRSPLVVLLANRNSRSGITLAALTMHV
jgi:hypothetical protein